MRSDDESVAAKLPLLAGLPKEHLGQLLKGAYLQRFPAHVELIRQGDPADFLHVVVDGQVEVYSHYRDRETTVAVIGPGDCFILAAVFLDRLYLKSARSLTPARLLLLPASAVREVFELDSGFARRLTAELALAYRSLVKELNNQKLRSSLERLANWIVLQDEASGRTGCFTLPFDKKVLAAKLGMAPEVLSRSFAALISYGIAVEGKSITLRDPVALRKFAKPSPLIDDAAS
jgi:CRP/FNR family transcriptional regulator, transcriptional activator FtrB